MNWWTAVIALAAVVPHIGHQRLPADRHPGLLGQPGKQVKLLGPQGNLDAGDTDPLACDVNPQLADRDLRGPSPLAAGPRRKWARSRASNSLSRTGLVR
jgi:hypothetical protein